MAATVAHRGRLSTDDSAWKSGATGRQKNCKVHSCGNRNVRDYLNCSGGNSRPSCFFEVWGAALFLGVAAAVSSRSSVLRLTALSLLEFWGGGHPPLHRKD